MTTAPKIVPKPPVTRLELALQLAADGFWILPLVPGDSKAAAIAFKDGAGMSQDHATLHRWFGAGNYEVAIATRRYRQNECLVIADEDNRDGKNGRGEILRLELDGFEFPETRTHETLSGGRHHIYRHSLPTGHGGANKVAPGVDLKAGNSYIAASLSGKLYACPSGAVAEAPQWLSDKCGRDQDVSRTRPAPTTTSDGARRRGREYLAGHASIAVKGSGGNSTAYRVYCQLRGYGYAKADADQDMLEIWNPRCPPGFRPELLTTIGDHAYTYAREDASHLDPQQEFTTWDAPNVAATATPAPVWIADINKHHATVNEFGKPIVYIFRPIAGDRHCKIERMTYDDFARVGEHDVVKVGNKFVPRNLAWRREPLHRHYSEVVFEPGQTTRPDTLNLWQGWPVDPVPGDWSLMQAHIRDVICESDPVRYDYAIRWLAWKVQHPGGRPEVAFTAHGHKGTGKGRFAHWYGRLFGEHRVTAKHRDEVLGRFNGHLHHCALLVAEEAFFARDPTVDGPLKVMITEPDYRVEYKFGASVRVPNRLAIIMLSNHDSVVPATADERRYFVTRVSSDRIRDFGYFNKLDAQMQGGGLSAMLHGLLTMDLTGFNIRDVPNTAALKEQKRHAVKGTEAWLWNVLEEGRIPGDFGGVDWTEAGLEIAKDRLYKAYRETDKPHALAESIFAKKLVDILGDAVKPTRPTRDKVRVYEWQFAPLPTCRAAFEAHMNVAGYEWQKC